MTELALLAALAAAAGLVVRLSVDLYAQRTVSATFRAVGQLARERRAEDPGWLWSETAASIKTAYVMRAYRCMPPFVGPVPAWLFRAAYGEQGFMDLVERQYEAARRMAIDTLDRGDDVKVDLD